MKKTIRFIALSVAMIAFTSNIFAQSASATATASAVILTPLAINRTANLHFGTATVTASAGTIVLTPAGARSATGGVTLYTVTPAATVASFDVTGNASTAIALTLPASVTIDDGATHTMTVDNFASNPTGAGLVLTAGGTLTITVGATLNVTGSQTPGTYTSATPFTVTVNYN